MLKKIVLMLMIAMASNVAVFAAGSSNNKQDDTAKVRAEIARLGIGRDAKVSVKLKDGKKIKGYVSDVKPNSFVVTDNKTGTATEVEYSQVRQAKGQNISLGVKIAIFVGIFIGFILLVGTLAKGS